MENQLRFPDAISLFSLPLLINKWWCWLMRSNMIQDLFRKNTGFFLKNIIIRCIHIVYTHISKGIVSKAKLRGKKKLKISSTMQKNYHSMSCVDFSLEEENGNHECYETSAGSSTVSLWEHWTELGTWQEICLKEKIIKLRNSL